MVGKMESKLKKIDMHCHTTNRKLGHTGECRATLDNILEKMKQHDIEKTVVLASYFPHRSSGITNFRLLHWLNENGNKDKFYFFGSLDFEHYFFQGMNELNELAESGNLNGVKIYTSYQKIDLKSKKFEEVVKLAKKYTLPLMFHTGYSYMAKRFYGRDSIDRMVRASDLEFIADKGITVIASHMGKPFFDDVTKTCKRNANIYTDVSGLVNSKYDQKDKEQCAEEVKKFVEMVGPNKLLFGTDFPVQTHEDSVYFVEEGMKGFFDFDKLKVYYHNANRILDGKKSTSLTGGRYQ
jgi:predicted TIM-barrel fold metal-dependent hydrolase